MAYKVNKQHRPLWNSDVDVWNDEMLEEARETFIEDGYSPDEITDEMLRDRIYEWNEMSLDDERCNLNIETGGYIVAFADLGFWNGRRKGMKLIGSNVRDIFDSGYGCENHDFYVDPYNVRYNGSHHDGSHHLVFRMVESRYAAERLEEWFCSLDYEPTEEEFRKKTKSIRKFVAKVYGW